MRESHIRLAIIEAAQQHERIQVKAGLKTKQIEAEQADSPKVPSAPPDWQLNPSAPSASGENLDEQVSPSVEEVGNVVARVHAECVVCMERQVSKILKILLPKTVKKLKCWKIIF